MRGWRLRGALFAAGLVMAVAPHALAQDVDYGDPAQFDRQPPPPPPPPDRDYGPGYRRPGLAFNPYRRGFDRPFLVCRTPYGACTARGPQISQARCRCDFGDGPVRGRLRP